MIDYIYFLIKVIMIQITQDTLPTKLILSCFFLVFLSTIKYYLKNKKTKITIEDLHISHINDLIPFIILFFSLYIFGLFYLRFCNFGHVLDLKEFYNKFIIFFANEKITYIIITILYDILLIIIFIILIIKIMKSIKLNLFKIHIYIISCFPLGFLQITPYTKITLKIQHFYSLLSNIFCSLYLNLKKNVYIYILKKEYVGYNISTIEIFLFKMRDKNALFILILLIFYDFFINNFVLTKMYYFIPIVFLYNLIKLLDQIISIYEPFEEGLIVSHLYFDIKNFNIITSEILYMNDFEATIQDLKNIEIKLNQEFN